MESILTSVKRLLGIDEEYEYFDQEIILNINSALMTLHQIGIGPKEGFVIVDDSQTWEDFIGERKDLESIKTYLYLKTRLSFDPPQTGYLVDAITKQISEIEWRLNVQVEGGIKA